jgi:alpha-1,3-mannosyltransferase
MAGVERFVMDLSHHLQRRGIRSEVLTLNRCFYLPGTLPTRETVFGISVVRIPYLGGQRLFFAPGVLRFVPDYDVVHVHNVDFFADFLTLTKLLHRKPVIVSTHGGFFHTKKLALFKNLYFRTVTRLLLPHADRVLAVSGPDRDLFAPLVSRITLVENGVDFGRLAGVRKAIEPGLLLYVGRLVSNKRVDNLIRGLALVRRAVPQAHLALVGCDYEGIADRLSELAAAQGVAEAVTLAGQVPDPVLSDWLTRAHLFVSASEYEGFGISVLEAMSTGTVPVVNALPAFRAFIEHGENGFLTDFSDPEQAARTLVRALQTDLDALAILGQRARQTAAGYAWDNVISSFISIYSEIAS